MAAPAVIRGAIPPAAAEGAARFAGRSWVVDEISDWATNGSERFLIIVGEPGWGKSALVAWLVGPDSVAAPPAAPVAAAPGAPVAAPVAAAPGAPVAAPVAAAPGTPPVAPVAAPAVAAPGAPAAAEPGAPSPAPSAGSAPAPSAGPAPATPPPIPWSAWHFCAAALTHTIDPQQFSASLSLQLASRFGDYGFAILKRAAPETTVNIKANTITGSVVGFHTDVLIVYARDAREVYGQAVREPLEAVVAGGQRADDIFIAVDGLDDALEFTSPNIVDLVAGSADFPDPVRFLVTTRDERRVLDLFTGGLDATNYRLIYVSNPDDEPTLERNDADVRSYVGSELARPPLAAKVESKSVPALIDAVVEVANGNFLVARFLLRQMEETGALPEGLPKGLYPLYGGYLRRLLPETRDAGISDEWRDDYQPLLGTLSVARPAAPAALIPGWLDRDLGRLNPVLVAVGQIVEYMKDEGGSRRLYHRSLAEYLALADIPGPLGDPQPNRYFVEPREQHDRIVRFYFGSFEKRWGASWKNADDYGLRQLVPHLYALYRLTIDPVTRATIATQLCDVALGDGYQVAQQERFGSAAATIEACRIAIQVSVEAESDGLTLERVRRLAQSREPAIRILASRVLDQLSRSDRAGILTELKGLVR